MADAFFSLFTNVTNLHTRKYKGKSAALEKFPKRNIHSKLIIFTEEIPNRQLHKQSNYYRNKSKINIMAGYLPNVNSGTTKARCETSPK